MRTLLLLVLCLLAGCRVWPDVPKPWTPDSLAGQSYVRVTLTDGSTFELEEPTLCPRGEGMVLTGQADGRPRTCWTWQIETIEVPPEADFGSFVLVHIIGTVIAGIVVAL